MDASCEETKRRFLLLKEEDGKLQEKITSKEAMAEQYKKQHRQQETELEKLKEEASEQQSQIVILPAQSEAHLNRLREKKRGQNRETEVP
jgi:ribosome-binding ATPase YchF (GTP1/OBG family)